MANYFLFVSSLAMAVIQLSTIYLMNLPLIFSVLAVIAFSTSLWNHGTTQSLAQKADRVYMVIYIATNTILIYNVVKDPVHMAVIYLIMASGIFCVISAMMMRKSTADADINNPYRINKPGNFYHLYSHIVVMVVHTMLSFTFAEDCKSDLDKMSTIFCVYDHDELLSRLLNM